MFDDYRNIQLKILHHAKHIFHLSVINGHWV